MTTAQTALHASYRLRPSWRPRYQPDVYVAASLDMLDGPVDGLHDPPVNLYWQPGRLDFADTGDIRRFYSSALTSTSTPAQLSQWINRDALVSQWRHLSLPPRVRRAWETLHPALREGTDTVDDFASIQDAILSVIAEHGFALADGSALIDCDIVSRDTDDIDAFNNRWDAEVFIAAQAAVLDVCSDRGWDAAVVGNEEFRKQIAIGTGGDRPIVVDMVYYERSQDPEIRADGGLRLIFSDVVGGKGVAVAESARGRDFDDLARIVSTDGWSLGRVKQAMSAIKYADKIPEFRTNLERFRTGEFDDDIRRSGFDPAFSHGVLD